MTLLLSPTLFIAPRPTTDLGDLETRAYDGLLCSVGYESRSRAIATRLAKRAGGIAAAGFTHNRTEISKENERQLVALDADIEILTDEEFASWAGDWLHDRAATVTTRVAVDISSTSRPRIAAVLEALRNDPSTDGIEVDFLYVPQRYEPAPAPIDASTALGPVTPGFAGWDADPTQPLAVVFGLGYEPARAAGALDELQPDLAVPFFPVGTDQRFVEDVRRENKTVLEQARVTDPIEYQITDPFDGLAHLDGVISHLEQDGHRIVLLPLGPKIFALIAMLAGIERTPVVPVWRISPGHLDKPSDRHPEDTLVTLRVANRPIEVDEDADDDEGLI